MTSADKRFVLGFVLGACLGGFSMFVMGHTSGARLEAQTSLAPDGPGAEEHQGASPLPAAIEPGKRALPTAAGGSSVDESEVQSLMASLERTPLARSEGAGVIYGHVRELDGAGVPGVLIRLTRVPAPGPGTSPAQVGVAAPPAETLEDVVREAAQRFRDSRASRFEALTDADGAYRVKNLGPHKWKVEAFLADHLVESDGASYAVRPGSELNFNATRLIEVQVAVLAPGGSPAQGASLQTELDGVRSTRKRYSWSPTEDFLRLVPGTYEIVAYSQGDTPPAQASASQRVTLAKDSGPLHFELSERREIRGRVSRAPGDPPADRFRVRLLALTPTQEVDLTLLASSKDSAWVREGAEYSFQDLEAGRYVVGAARTYTSPIVVQRVLQVTEGTLQCDLQMPAIERSRMLRVTVQGPGGEPLGDVSFQLKVTRPRSTRSGSVSPLREKDGSFLIGFKPADARDYFGEQVTEAQFELLVSHPDYGSRKRSLSRGQPEVSLSFSSPGVLRISVAGYSGSGYEGRLQLNVQKLGSDTFLNRFSSSKRERLDPEGVGTVEALEPGRYRIRLELLPVQGSDQWFGGQPIDALEMEVLAGDNSADLSIPALYSLRVHWADSKPGAGIYLRPLESSELMATSFNGELGPDGYADWDELLAGKYTLSGGGNGRLQMTVTVPAGIVEFEPKEINALRLHIYDSQGDLSRVGFEDGDLIIGRDGVEFPAPPEAALWSSLTNSKGAEIDFLVLRGTRRIELLVQGSELGDWQSMGGRLMPAVH